MSRDTENRLSSLEHAMSEQAEPIQLNLDALTPEARADFLAHYSEGSMDVKAMQSETLRAVLEQCGQLTEQPTG